MLSIAKLTYSIAKGREETKTLEASSKDSCSKNKNESYY